jgi:hypothetical protein
MVIGIDDQPQSDLLFEQQASGDKGLSFLRMLILSCL